MRMGATGVQYVTGTPPQTPVLRPLRQPLYDTEELTDGATGSVILFTDHKKFASGATKTECDTNLTQDGQLGYPLEFDLIGFLGEAERGIDSADHDDIYNKIVFKWFFGANVPWLRVPLTKIPEGIGKSGAGTTDMPVNGWPVVTNFFNFSSPDRKARRVSSTETFRCELLICAALSLTATRKFRVFMLGILYQQL